MPRKAAALDLTESPEFVADLALWQEVHGLAVACKKFETARLQDAWGLIQYGGDMAACEKYATTTRFCSCEYQKFNPSGTCKHRIARMMRVKFQILKEKRSQ